MPTGRHANAFRGENDVNYSTTTTKPRKCIITERRTLRGHWKSRAKTLFIYTICNWWSLAVFNPFTDGSKCPRYVRQHGTVCRTECTEWMDLMNGKFYSKTINSKLSSPSKLSVVVCVQVLAVVIVVFISFSKFLETICSSRAETTNRKTRSRPDSLGQYSNEATTTKIKLLRWKKICREFMCVLTVRSSCRCRTQRQFAI